MVGSFSENILYAYIELYNVHGFIVILNSNYSGPDYSSSYIYDVLKNKVLDKNVQIEYSKFEINKMPQFRPDNVEELYIDRLQKFATTNGLELAKKGIDSQKPK